MGKGIVYGGAGKGTSVWEERGICAAVEEKEIAARVLAEKESVFSLVTGPGGVSAGRPSGCASCERPHYGALDLELELPLQASWGPRPRMRKKTLIDSACDTDASAAQNLRWHLSRFYLHLTQSLRTVSVWDYLTVTLFLVLLVSVSPQLLWRERGSRVLCGPAGTRSGGPFLGGYRRVRGGAAVCG